MRVEVAFVVQKAKVQICRKLATAELCLEKGGVERFGINIHPVPLLELGSSLGRYVMTSNYVCFKSQSSHIP